MEKKYDRPIVALGAEHHRRPIVPLLARAVNSGRRPISSSSLALYRLGFDGFLGVCRLITRFRLGLWKFGSRACTAHR